LSYCGVAPQSVRVTTEHHIAILRIGDARSLGIGFASLPASRERWARRFTMCT
jgi:hypothetical protein